MLSLNLLSPASSAISLSRMSKALHLLLLSISVSALTREELMEHLRSKQETANTFDSRVPRLIRPIGYIAGEPIWPRILERVQSKNDLFFDDDNFAYALPRHDAVGLVRKMDRESNFEKVVEFLEKYS